MTVREMEQALRCRQMAAEERSYQCSRQAKIDLDAARVRRAKADLAAGHLPSCSLTKCDSQCDRA
jgi:hypothetical protein